MKVFPNLPFLSGTSPSTLLSTSGHKRKREIRHSTVKFQEKKGERKDTLKLRKGVEAQFELISQVNMFSVFSYDVKCKEVCFWV